MFINFNEIFIDPETYLKDFNNSYFFEFVFSNEQVIFNKNDIKIILIYESSYNGSMLDAARLIGDTLFKNEKEYFCKFTSYKPGYYYRVYIDNKDNLHINKSKYELIKNEAFKIKIRNKQ